MHADKYLETQIRLKYGASTHHRFYRIFEKPGFLDLASGPLETACKPVMFCTGISDEFPKEDNDADAP